LTSRELLRGESKISRPDREGKMIEELFDIFCQVELMRIPLIFIFTSNVAFLTLGIAQISRIDGY
jgi:hypothetical protein